MGLDKFIEKEPMSSNKKDKEKKNSLNTPKNQCGY